MMTILHVDGCNNVNVHMAFVLAQPKYLNSAVLQGTDGGKA